MGDRLKWLEDATSIATANAMPHYMALSWFNYVRRPVHRQSDPMLKRPLQMKGYDFRIGATAGDSIVAAYLKN